MEPVHRHDRGGPRGAGVQFVGEPGQRRLAGTGCTAQPHDHPGRGSRPRPQPGARRRGHPPAAARPSPRSSLPEHDAAGRVEPHPEARRRAPCPVASAVRTLASDPSGSRTVNSLPPRRACACRTGTSVPARDPRPTRPGRPRPPPPHRSSPAQRRPRRPERPVAEERGHLAARRVPPQRGGVVDLQQAALGEDCHPVGDRERLVLVVGHVERRDARGAQGLVQHAHEVFAQPAVERGQRLVQQQQPGPGRQ